MEERKRVRRHHSAEFKARVVTECERPGAVIAAVARTHGVGAKLVRQWRRRGGTHGGFIPVTVQAPQTVAPATPAIQIEVRRAGAVVEIRWPLAAAGACAEWLRGFLA